MGPFSRYRRFEGLSEEEVNAGLREEARERRARALARVDPLDCSRTTSPHLPPAEVVSAITYAARRGLHRYSEGRDGALRDALARRHAVDAARIVVGEGASGLLQRAAHELLDEEDEVVLPWPGYPLYPMLVRDAGATPVPVPSLDPGDLLAAVTPRTRMVLIGGPHDPTGELLSATTVEALIQRLPERVLLVVDEALREFVDAESVDAVLRLTDRWERLIVVRSFSKAWGLAGLRCGYAVGGPSDPGRLRGLAPRLGIGDLALAGALAAVTTSGSRLDGRVRAVAAQRRTLTARLRAAGLLVTDAQGPTLWARAPGIDAGALTARMAEATVIVQSGAPLGDHHHVRITVGDDAATERIVRAATAALAR
ncbi:MAG: histidinol-phosphate transaminase [Solirubrobacteraceae bacterium]